jgi:hypothetical protein
VVGFRALLKNNKALQFGFAVSYLVKGKNLLVKGKDKNPKLIGHNIATPIVPKTTFSYP